MPSPARAATLAMAVSACLKSAAAAPILCSLGAGHSFALVLHLFETPASLLPLAVALFRRSCPLTQIHHEGRSLVCSLERLLRFAGSSARACRSNRSARRCQSPQQR